MHSRLHELESWISEHDDVKWFRFNTPVKSVAQAVEVSGQPKSSIIKTIILKHRTTEQFVACIITASARVDKKKIQEGVGGKRWSMATRDEIQEICGYPVGGVPPVCLGSELQKLVDPRVMEKDFVIGGGGTTTSLLGLPPQYIIQDGAIPQIISYG